MTEQAPIRVTADTSGFDAAMADMAKSTEAFGRIFAGTMSRAVISGRDLDDTLRSIALRFADMALGKALAPLENALSGLAGGLFSGAAAPAGSGLAPAATKIVFNVASQDSASFAKSEGQITAMLARAVGRGQRNI